MLKMFNLRMFFTYSHKFASEPNVLYILPQIRIWAVPTDCDDLLWVKRFIFLSYYFSK